MYNYMTDKIDAFLRETALKDATKVTWGIGTMVAKACTNPVLSLLSVHSAQDQILISGSREIVLPIIAETLEKIGRALRDPALFDLPTATFAVLMGKAFLGQYGQSSLVFVTLKAVSESSTHVLIEGYAKGFSDGIANSGVKRVREGIGARFR